MSKQLRRDIDSKSRRQRDPAIPTDCMVVRRRVSVACTENVRIIRGVFNRALHKLYRGWTQQWGVHIVSYKKNPFADVGEYSITSQGGRKRTLYGGEIHRFIEGLFDEVDDAGALLRSVDRQNVEQSSKGPKAA